MLLDSLLEFLEDRIEIGEDIAVACAFLEYMVKQAHANYEFFGVFFGDIALGGYFLGHGSQIVVTAEVEVHHFLNLAVHNFGDIEVVGTFFFVAVTITVHNSLCFLLAYDKHHFRAKCSAQRVKRHFSNCLKLFYRFLFLCLLFGNEFF
jgi:hypothetical protein